MSHTLLDLLKLNGADQVNGLIEEVRTVAPEVTIIPARTIRGTSYPVAVRSGLPTVGFRAANAGQDPSKSRFTTRNVETFILDGRIEVDKAVATGYEDGPDALIALEARAFTQAAILTIGSQTFYGDATASKGFFGLRKLATEMGSLIEDAGGSAPGTGSSAYLISAGNQGVQYVYGNNTSLNLSAIREGDATDADGKRFSAFIADMTGRVGLQCVNKHAVAILKDLTEDAGRGLTDAKVLDLLRKAPVGANFTHLIISPRSAFQLAISRTITPNQKAEVVTGLVNGFPTESCGIPIIVTNSITDTEALT